ncbi:MAG: WD40 repeat domain-containing protein, partial [Planctomycetota bacterium]
MIWPNPLRSVFAPLRADLSRILRFQLLSSESFVTLHEEGALRCWSVDDYRERWSRPASEGPRCADIVGIDDGAFVAAAYRAGQVAIIDAANGREVRKLPGEPRNWLGLRSSPAGVLFSWDRRGVVTAWRTDEAELAGVLRKDGGGAIRSLAVSDAGDLAVVVGQNNRVSLWSVDDAAEIAHRTRSPVAALSSNGETWCWTSPRGVRMGSIRDLDSFPLPESRKGARSLSFSDDSSLLLATLGDDTSRVWRVADRTLVWTFREGGAEPERAEFSPDNTFAFTLSKEGVFRLWGLSDGLEYATIDTLVTPRSVRFDTHSARMFALTQSGQLRSWPIRPLATAERARPRSIEAREAKRFHLGSESDQRQLARDEEIETIRLRLSVLESMAERGAIHRNALLLTVRDVERLLQSYGDDAKVQAYVEALAHRAAERGESTAVSILVALADVQQRLGHPVQALRVLEYARSLPATQVALALSLNRLRGELKPSALTCRSIERLRAREANDDDSLELDASSPRAFYATAVRRARENEWSEVLGALARISPADGDTRASVSLLAAKAHAAQGDYVAAVSRLSGELSKGTNREEELWSEWFRICAVDWKLSPRQIAEQIRPIPAKTAVSRRFHRLVETMGRGESLRVNCGGAEYRDSKGNLWAGDAFFRSGDPMFGALNGIQHLAGFYDAIEGSEDPIL